MANADLSRSYEHARRLLDCAAMQGLALKDEIVQPIVDFDVATPTTAAEATFWPAYAALAKQIAPVTIASLDALALPTPRRGLFGGLVKQTLCEADRAINYYRKLAWAALACLSVTQIYFLIGSTVVANIEKLPKDIQATTDKIISRKAQLQQASAASNTSGVRPALITNLADREDSAADDPEIGRLEGERSGLEVQLAASYHVLAGWNVGWHSLLRLPIVREVLAGADGTEDKPARPTEAQVREHNVLAASRAQFVLSAMQLYLLPFVYGFLGTCVYIVRNLATEIKTLSYSSDAAYRLRLPLGALAGVAIAWFINPQTSAAMMGSLSPFALAFLAGYSVEVLFGAMDRFIDAFSSGSSSGVSAAATR